MRFGLIGSRRTRYTANLAFCGGWWSVEVPELAAVVTHVSDRRRAEGAIREAIAMVADVDPGSFDLVMRVDERWAATA